MNPDELEKRIEESIPDIQAISAKSELMAAQSARVQLELRTFATGGSGVKDVSGKALSGYVKPKLVDGKYGPKKDKYGTWAEKRENAGLQTNHKDLSFTGEFSRSFIVGISNERPAFGIVNSKAAEIAEGQEEQNNTKIFQLNETERENVKADIKNMVMNSLRDLVSKWKD